MRRILIVGNSGAGKSTLARRLGARLGLPVIHLDVVFWKPGWVESDDETFRAATKQALSAETWVCDGNFGDTWDLRMPLADTVIWLRQRRLVCVWRAFTRVFKYSARRGRPDMAGGCVERVSPSFYRFIWSYDAEVAPRLEAAIAQYAGHARVVRLNGDREATAFLESLPQTSPR